MNIQRLAAEILLTPLVEQVMNNTQIDELIGRLKVGGSTQDRLDAIEALQRLRDAPRAHLAWLVERQENGRAVWCTANYQWTTDANEAVWFARREDAELFSWNLSGDSTVTEHCFS